MDGVIIITKIVCLMALKKPLSCATYYTQRAYLLTKSKIDLEIQTERAGIIAHSCGFLQKTDKSRNAINWKHKNK